MIEYISVHLPKTAGTTFRYYLQSIFPDGVLLDYGVPLVEIYPNCQVIHGHFPYKRYSNRFPKAKLITWLRNPVERIVSYYYYWLNLPPHGNKNHDVFLDSKMNLVEFASFEPIVNEFSSIFLNSYLDDFFFVGITECLITDLFFLASSLSWKLKPIKRLNTNPIKQPITKNQRVEIANIHFKEIKVYEHYKSLSIRRAGILNR